MAKAIATDLLPNTEPGAWYDVRIGWTAIGWRAPGRRRAWISGANVGIAMEPATDDVEADVRWILEQIPGCADLEIEWVNE